MGEISNDEGTSVESFVCSETYAVSSDTRGPVETTGCVDTHVDLVVLGAKEAR